MTLYLFFFESCVCFAELLSLFFLASEVCNFTFLMRHLNRSRVFLPKKKKTFSLLSCCVFRCFFFFEFSAAVFSSFFFLSSSFKHADVPVNVTLCSNSLYVFCLSFFFRSFVLSLLQLGSEYSLFFLFVCLFLLPILAYSIIEFLCYCRSLSMAFFFSYLLSLFSSAFRSLQASI